MNEVRTVKSSGMSIESGLMRPEKGMKVTIVGSGAIGGLAGAYMSMAGEDVLFVDRWVEHVKAMNEKGLEISGIRGNILLRDVEAVTPEQIREPPELLIISTKSQHTEEALRGVLSYITPKTIVVSFQNGFNIERISKYVSVEQIIGGIPDYTGALVDPGHLEYTAEGPARIGELDGKITERIRHLEWLFSRLTYVDLSSNIIGVIWGKQVHLSMVVMCALVDATSRDILGQERYRLMGGALCREAMRIAHAAGVVLPERMQIYDPNTPEETQRFVRYVEQWISHRGERRSRSVELVKKGGGMWWDIVYRKRKSETTELTGALVGRAKRLAVQAPGLEKVTQMIYEIEEGKRSLGWYNLDELEAYMKSVGCVLPT